MNSYNHKPKAELRHCPICGMDSGERKESVNIPTRYYVRCASCGYIVGGKSQSVATARWNKKGKDAE